MAGRKTRSDSWGADLPEEMRWRIYDELGALAFGEDAMTRLSKMCAELPSRAGWYRFLSRMRQADAERRIEKIAQSVAEAERVADKHGVKAAVLVETLKTLAVDRAMTGDDTAAQKFAAAAASIWDRAQREREIELKQSAQRTRDEQLKLAREKFEFDAAKTAMAKAAEIKSISADDTLAADEKIARVRAALFGVDSSAAKDAKDAE